MRYMYIDRYVSGPIKIYKCCIGYAKMKNISCPIRLWAVPLVLALLSGNCPLTKVFKILSTVDICKNLIFSFCQ